MPKISPFRTFLKKANLFRIPVPIFFEKRVYFDSKAGRFTSFLFCLILLLATVYFGQDFYYKRNPFVNSHLLTDDNPARFEIDIDQFPIAVHVQNHQINFSIFQKVIENNKEKFSQTNIESEPCTKEHFKNSPDIFQKFGERTDIHNLHCMNRTQKQNFVIEGAFKSSRYIAFNVQVKKCFNKTYCANNTEMRSVIKEGIINSEFFLGYVGLFLPNYLPDLQNYEKFYTVAIENPFTNFNFNTKKQNVVYFRNSYLTTDNGVIFENLKHDRIIEYDNSQEFTYFPESYDTLLTEFILRFGPKKHLLFRNYKRFQTVIAEVGGVLNIFYFIGYILTSFITKFYFFVHLINLFGNDNVNKIDKNYYKDENDINKNKIDYFNNESNYYFYFISIDEIDLEINQNNIISKRSSDFKKVECIELEKKSLNSEPSIESPHYSKESTYFL